MNNKLEKLKEVLSVQSASYEQWRMFAYIIRQVYEYDFYVDDGNIYIEKGFADTKPCIVAHMDTVHDITEDLSILEVDGKLTGFNRVKMTQTGIGGDDKVGIFIALECLHHFDNIKVAFFRDEEVGCDGSGVADMRFFDNCTFVLQCDRRGNGDFITNASGTELSSSRFQKSIKSTIKKYGYSFANGMMTDVMTLKQNGLGVSCANISCGYYNPHCKNEYVVVKDVMNCLDLVMEIMTNFGTETFEHKYTPSWSSDYSWSGYSYNKDNEKTETKFLDTFDESPTWRSLKDTMVDSCPCCNVTARLDFDDYYQTHLCKDCKSMYCF
jgi:putative aminopeptidase FrvX